MFKLQATAEVLAKDDAIAIQQGSKITSRAGHSSSQACKAFHDHLKKQPGTSGHWLGRPPRMEVF